MAMLNVCSVKMQDHMSANLLFNSRANILYIRPLLSEVTVFQIVLTQGLSGRF